MIRYKCTVAYDGSAYCGWQTQKNGNSVQEQIEAALQHITGESIRILAAGRTDAGVNAWGQVFQFDMEQDMTERKLMGAINGFLPPDIHIRRVEKKDRLFHARYCVRSKRYDYNINFGEYDVFSRNHAYQCPYRVDIERMKQGARYLVGTHDFTSFNSNSLKETPDQVRTIESIDFTEAGDRLTISYRGRGFLRYMVRMMTAQLLDVGRGKLEPEDIRRILEARSKTIARRNAHPEGLTLMEISYFEVLAETGRLTVREVLPEDEAALAGIRTSYVLADRHTNEVYGIYEAAGAGGILTCWKDCGEELDCIVEGLKTYENRTQSGRTVQLCLRQKGSGTE